MSIRLWALLLLPVLLLGCERGRPASSTSDPTPTEHSASVGAAPNWTSVGEALGRAESSGQPMMVFVYTDWCGWCQRTFQTTFQDQTVLRFLHENFQAVKLNAESSQPVDYKGRRLPEGMLANLLGASGFPTFVFLDSDGVPVFRTSGYRAAEGYLELLKYVADRGYREQSFEDYLASI